MMVKRTPGDSAKLLETVGVKSRSNSGEEV
jgi:hypothetical protein